MKKGLIQIIIVIAILVVAIKFVPPINDWARGNLPEPVLTLIGEKPKNVFERGGDAISDGLNKTKNAVKDLVDKVSD